MFVHVRASVVAKGACHHADLRLDRIPSGEHYDDVVSQASHTALGFEFPAASLADAAHREPRKLRQIDHCAQEFDVGHARSILQSGHVAPCLGR